MTAPTPEKHQVLIVDDEPDIHLVTRLCLKGLKVEGRGISLLSASSGREALEILRENPQIAVVLLDVVMEHDSAGLDTCRAIRGEQQNRMVRILLRTGQPGAAPERETIDQYDIDGYLPKAELTSQRLYTAVRTGIKAWRELVELDRHRRYLSEISTCVIGLRSFLTLPESLRLVLHAAHTLCPSPLTALHLETFNQKGEPLRHDLHLSDPVAAEAIRARVARENPPGGRFAEGYLIPLQLHRELGHGWLYVAQPEPDELLRISLLLLAEHAKNALYSTVAEELLRAQKDQPFFDEMAI